MSSCDHRFLVLQFHKPCSSPGITLSLIKPHKNLSANSPHFFIPIQSLINTLTPQMLLQNLESCLRQPQIHR